LHYGIEEDTLPSGGNTMFCLPTFPFRINRLVSRCICIDIKVFYRQSCLYGIVLCRYRDITADRHTQNEQSKVTKRPIVVVSARLYKFEKMPTTIHVFRNGDELFKGVKFVLSKRDLHNWDQLLTLIGDKIQLRTGAARK
jgi:hypothetical protein